MTTFHVGVLPNQPVAEVAALAADAEKLGFTGIWVADSQSIFCDAYVTLAGCALSTSREVAFGSDVNVDDLYDFTLLDETAPGRS